MTACMYISPPNSQGIFMPAVLSDTLATTNDGNNHSVPSSRFFSVDGTPTNPASLYRKSYIYDKKAVLSYAGYLDSIENFAALVEPQFKHALNKERPMLRIGELADEIDGLRVVGGTYVEQNGCPGINSIVRGVECTLQHLGLVRAVGSGKKDVIDKARDWDSCIGQSSFHGSRDGLVYGFCSALNIEKLRVEAYGGKLSDWGAFFEYTYFDWSKKCWFRSPRQIYLFYFWDLISDGTVSVWQYPIQFCYDPGKSINGDAFVWVIDTRECEGNAVHWTIKSILDPGDDWYQSEEKRNEFWGSWNPEAATVCLVRSKEGMSCPDGIYGGINSPIIVSLTDDQMNGFVFSYDYERLRVGMNENLHRELFGRIFSSFGKELKT